MPAAGARITAERVATSLRARFDPLPTLSPRRLVQSLQQFEHGYLDLAARTWDAMERRDDRLAAVSAKAKGALARYGFEVLVHRDVPPARQAEAARHRAALEFLYGRCTATNAVREDERGGFSLLVRQMADAIGKRYSVHEIVWEPGADGQLTATFRHAPLWFFEATAGRLRYKLEEGAATGVDLDPDQWLVTVGEGIMEACSVLWVYKHLPLRDWLAYSEKFGMPYLLGKTQAAFNSAEWQAMAAALRGFGSDGAAVVGGADDIVPVAAGGGSEGTPFAGLVERSERAMSILWRGADLGTQAHSGAGRGQGASLQADETSALDEDRAASLTESLASVSRTAIRYLFGEGVQPLAFVRIKTQVRQDIQLDLAVDAFLLSNGAPVSVADVLARYGRALPAAGAALLKPAGGGAGGGGGRGGGVKGAASEDATLAGIERAANSAAGLIAAENFNPNHDKRGRFTTSDGATTPDDKDASEADATAEDQNSFYHPEDVLGSSEPDPKSTVAPGWSLFFKFLKGAVSPLGPIVRALGLEGQDQQIEGMQDLVDLGTGGISAMERAEGDPEEEKKLVQGYKHQLTTPEGIGSLVTTALLGKFLGGRIGSAMKAPLKPAEPLPRLAPEAPQQRAEPAPSKVSAAPTRLVASVDSAKAPELRMIDPAELRWSQTSAGGKGRTEHFQQSFAEQGGWTGEPIDVVQTPRGLVTLDHTRALVALEQGISSIPARVHSLDEALPADMLTREWNRAGDIAQTWGRGSPNQSSRTNTTY